MAKITEGAVYINIPELQEIPTKNMPAFYNPLMQHNRDISIALLNKWIQKQKKSPTIALPLAGTGIRACRFAKELDSFTSIEVNDLSKDAVNIIKENARLNKVSLAVNNTDANIFLLQSKGFDYIDIDPFGSPVPFLDTACKYISRNGILAITATDTAPLAGTYPKTCQRRYDATPLRCPQMHEFGLRILIRKAQTVAAQYDKALIPVLAYYKDHYFRVYFQAKKSKQLVNQLRSDFHNIVYYKNQEISMAAKKEYVPIGPLYTGPLKQNSFLSDAHPFVKDMKDELDVFSTIHLPEFCKQHRIAQIAPLQTIIDSIKQKNYQASKTHIDPESIKTDIPHAKLKHIMQKLSADNKRS